MQLFFTKETSWIQKWDDYLQKTERGLYNQLTDWILFYKNFGFDFELLLAIENDTIVGGCAMVIAKATVFKFAIVPSGPVIDLEFESEIDTMIPELREKAIQLNCCYFQISLPILADQAQSDFKEYTIQNYPQDGFYYSGTAGTKFKFVIPLYGMRLIDLRNVDTSNFNTLFSKNHKRNYQKALQNDLNFKFVAEPEDIKIAYNCFEQNAKDKGYGLRDFSSMEKMLHDLVSKDYAKIGICYYQENPIGAIYVIKTGQRLIYINGGVLKNFQHLYASHFMHAKVIQYSIDNNYKSYDISVGGSKGVIQFKDGFGADLQEFVATRYFVLKPFRFTVYQKVEAVLRNNKALIAKLLLLFRQKK